VEEYPLLPMALHSYEFLLIAYRCQYNYDYFKFLSWSMQYDVARRKV